MNEIFSVEVNTQHPDTSDVSAYYVGKLNDALRRNATIALLRSADHPHNHCPLLIIALAESQEEATEKVMKFCSMCKQEKDHVTEHKTSLFFKKSES